VSTTREELDRLLSLFRKGAISEAVLLDQLEQLSAEGRDESDTDAGDEAQAQETSETRLATLLDEFRAAEASGAQTLSRWAEQSDDPRLVGGLRVLAAREYGHAVLLEHRLRELGAEPRAEIPSWLASFNKALIASDASDIERLGALVAQFADTTRSTERIDRAIAMAGEDGITREVLAVIKTDELATIEWLRHAYHDRNGGDSDEDGV